MIKNILIIFLIYIISSLLIANPNNIEIFDRTFLKAKKLVETGYDHIENKLIGVTYEALNVWVFLIIVPLSLVISVAINFYFLWKPGRHKRSLPVMEKNLIKANPYAKTLPSYD